MPGMAETQGFLTADQLFEMGSDDRYELFS